MHRKDDSMITTRGCLSFYRKDEDPSSKINAWLEANPDARLVDVKLLPTDQYTEAMAYVLMILELPDDDKQED